MECNTKEQKEIEEQHRQRSRLVGTGRTSCSGGATAATRSCELSALDRLKEGWLRWTYDTCAAISAFPVNEKIGTETQANKCSYKIASGELISDRDGLRVQGTAEYRNGVTFRCRKADVHKTLISASKVHSKGHVAVVDSEEGYIFLHNSTHAIKIQQFVQNEIVNELGSIRLYLESGAYIGYTKILQHAHMKRSTIVFDACETIVGRSSALSVGVGPMASVDQADSCLPAETLQIVPNENEIVDEGIDDEAIEVQRPKCCCDRTWTDQAGS